MIDDNGIRTFNVFKESVLLAVNLCNGNPDLDQSHY